MVLRRAFVSVIIPCYNEEKLISRCIESILRNDWPKESLEILIYDGGSTDKTLEILKQYEKYEFIKIKHNPGKIQTKAINMGIRDAKGEIIIRCDAHAEYPKNYISEIMKGLMERKVDNVGGFWDIQPGDITDVAKAISIVLKHPLGSGFSYRNPSIHKKPKYATMVPFGAWKKEVFGRIGMFDENFEVGEDMDFNIRLRKSGGKILLLPLKIRYYARATIKELLKMAYRYGYAKAIIFKKHKTFANYRQLFPPLFVVLMPLAFIKSIFLLYAFYFSLIFLLGIYESIKHNQLKLALYIPLTIFTMHMLYGMGFLNSLLKILFYWCTWCFKREIERFF